MSENYVFSIVTVARGPSPVSQTNIKLMLDISCSIENIYLGIVMDRNPRVLYIVKVLHIRA